MAELGFNMLVPCGSCKGTDMEIVWSMRVTDLDQRIGVGYVVMNNEA